MGKMIKDESGRRGAHGQVDLAPGFRCRLDEQSIFREENVSTSLCPGHPHGIVAMPWRRFGLNPVDLDRELRAAVAGENGTSERRKVRGAGSRGRRDPAADRAATVPRQPKREIDVVDCQVSEDAALGRRLEHPRWTTARDELVWPGRADGYDVSKFAALDN